MYGFAEWSQIRLNSDHSWCNTKTLNRIVICCKRPFGWGTSITLFFDWQHCFIITTAMNMLNDMTAHSSTAIFIINVDDEQTIHSKAAFNADYDYLIPTRNMCYYRKRDVRYISERHWEVSDMRQSLHEVYNSRLVATKLDLQFWTLQTVALDIRRTTKKDNLRKIFTKAFLEVITTKTY